MRVTWLADGLPYTPAIIAAMALARERALDTVYVPATDAREATRLGDGATPGSGVLEGSN